MKRKQTGGLAGKRRKGKVKRRKRKIPEVKKTIATPKTWKAVEPVGMELETKIRVQHIRRILQPILQMPKRFLFVQEWYNSAIQPKMQSVMSSMNTITGIEKKYESEYEFASTNVDQEVRGKLCEVRDGTRVIQRLIKKYMETHVVHLNAYCDRYAKRIQTWWKRYRPISIMNEDLIV